ncbi:MAG: hypothetical protein WC401_07275 [Bacteroidales bacterium]
MTDKDKLIEKQREALRKIAFPLKYLKDKADKEGAIFNGMMALQICQDANWLKQIAKDCLMETGELEAKMKEITDEDIKAYAKWGVKLIKYSSQLMQVGFETGIIMGAKAVLNGEIKHIE